MAEENPEITAPSEPFEDRLVRFLPQYRSSDFWFLRRKFNPAHGLFCNTEIVEVSEGTTQIDLPGLFTRPVTFAGLFVPSAKQYGQMQWGPVPFSNRVIIYCDETGLLTVTAGAPSGDPGRAYGEYLLPMGRMSFIVVSIVPSSGKLRVWRNGTPIIRSDAVGGALTGAVWATNNQPAFVDSSGDMPTIVGKRMCAFFNQIPRAFN